MRTKSQHSLRPNPAPQKHAPRRSGLTLIELLLTVAIFGTISATVAVVFNTSVTTWRAGTTLADEARNADAIMEQIVMALRSAYYPESSSPTYEYGFKHEDGGDAPKAEDIVSWVKIGNSLIGEDTPWAGAAHRVELRLGNESDGPGLYVKAWQLAGLSEDFDPEKDAIPLLLSDQVVSFNIQMRDPDHADTPGDPYEWLDEWTPSNRIPTHLLVSIAVKPPTEKGDPLKYSRMIDIPMSTLSWNPIQTTGGSNNRQGQGGGGRPGGGNGMGRPGGGRQPGQSGGGPGSGGISIGGGNTGGGRGGRGGDRGGDRRGNDRSNIRGDGSNTRGGGSNTRGGGNQPGNFRIDQINR